MLIRRCLTPRHSAPGCSGVDKYKLIGSDKYLICDIVSAGGDELIQELMSQIKRPYNAICYVREYRKFDNAERALFSIFYNIFRRYKDHILIILTKSNPELLEEKRSDILEQMKVNDIQIVPVNFPDISPNSAIEQYYRDQRKISLQRLEEALEYVKKKNGSARISISERSVISELDNLCMLREFRLGKQSQPDKRKLEDVVTEIKKDIENVKRRNTDNHNRSILNRVLRNLDELTSM